MSGFVLRRQAARVVLLDGTGAVLLIRARDPAAPASGHWWEIPGGGMDPHETSAEAAARELREETGITAVEIGPCVWVQHAQFTFAGIDFDQHERVHVAWTDEAHEVRPAGLEALEAQAFHGHRWWGLPDLLDSDERVLPHRLRDHLPDLVDGRLPDTPIDITHRGGWS